MELYYFPLVPNLTLYNNYDIIHQYLGIYTKAGVSNSALEGLGIGFES
jgi:hypothetical protein